MTDTHVRQAQELTQEILDLMQIEATIVVEPKDNSVVVHIETQDSGTLIGKYGRTLNSLQIIVGRMLFKKNGTWLPVLIDVGGYQSRRQAQLEETAQTVASRVAHSGEPEVLANLTPYERHLVHSVLADHPQVFSESTGEGRQRRLMIKKKI